MKHFAPWMLILLAPLLLSMGKKDDFTISFHSQGSNTDMPKTVFPMTLDGQSLLFKALPEISHNNINAFHAFPAASGGYGLALKLDFRGANSLELLTRTKQGEYLLTLINGKPADYVIIDRIVNDGMITIWQGVPESVIKSLEKKYPRIKPSSTTPTSSDKFDMAPTTPSEKKSFFKRFKKEEREATKRRKSGTVDEEPTTPSFNLPGNADPSLPAAPTSPQMPIEGLAPNPAQAPLQPAPLPEPALPR